MVHAVSTKNDFQEYYGFLYQIKDDLDPLLKKMRSQRDEKWVGKAWIGPVKQIAGYVKHFKVLSTIKWASLPLIGQAIIVLGGVFKVVPVWLIFVISPIFLFLIYFFYVGRYINKMATVGRPEFHLGALKSKRPAEYKIWNSLLQKESFTFGNLYEVMHAYINPPKDSSVESVLHYSMGHESALMDTIEELKNRLEDYEDYIEDMNADLENAEQSIEYLVQLQKDINTNLYRMVNDIMDFDDLRIITPFTVYEVDGNYLRKIKDVGTSGGSLKEIDMTLSQGKEYAAVTAAKSGTFIQAFESNPYPGRTVVSFAMNMLQGQKWIWCFHFDESNKRALSLTKSNDIIEVRQIRRLIHAFCLLIQKRMILEKEAAEDVRQSQIQ
ncbi:nucleoprotein TPR-like [Dorcoceras hygrometricum]|uniref:Nucleoprotein TPR-like n=1 Tax=Dorcoceras hygrometricum TaxID=472368 RepID=A0A2Z6ZX94_9LAMI|nr:nucleoprotein TPR-like [Dorcoceras hygrometricum]